MIEKWFTKKVKTQRLTRKGGEGADKDTETWKDELPEVLCHIQTWAEGTTGYEGATFPTHQMWCGIDTNIKKGDRILDEENTYEVYSVEKLNFGHNPHLQVFLSLIKLEEGS